MSETNDKETDQNQNHEKHLKFENNKWTFPRPNNILLDLYGCVASWNFIQDTLKPYFYQHIQSYLEEHWNDNKIQRIIQRFREQAIIHQNYDSNIPQIEAADKDKESVLNSAIVHIRWLAQSGNRTSYDAYNILRNLIWTDGYKSGQLKTHVFDDVPDAFHQWRMVQFIKLYGFASGPSEGQKLYYKSTIKGDLTKYFNNFIDASGKKKLDPKKYEILAKSLRDIPKNIVFFTDSTEEAKAAQEAGMISVVVIREGNSQYDQRQLQNLYSIKSLNQIEFDESSAAPPCC